MHRYLSGQVKDLVEKLEQVEGNIAHSGRLGGMFQVSERKKQNVSQLAKLGNDACKISTEQVPIPFPLKDFRPARELILRIQFKISVLSSPPRSATFIDQERRERINKMMGN